MTRFLPLLLALALFPGCESLNDSLVLQSFKDQRLSDRLNSQIRVGLEKRKAKPPAELQRRPAPDFLDLG